MIECDFDVSFVADLALREKSIQQNYRPPIAVHKWFARRPGTLFRGLLLSEFVDVPLPEAFYRRNELGGIRIADPFMGGGTPLLEANRVGCDVVGYDINPMAYWIVRQEIEHLDLVAYRKAAAKVRGTLEKEVGHLYRTKCVKCGDTQAHVKYFLWVKTQSCRNCGKDIFLFPGYLVAQNRRHPRNVFLCSRCGELSEKDNRRRPGKCDACGHSLSYPGPAARGSCACPHCAEWNNYHIPGSGPPKHTMFAIEYHCWNCRPRHKGRFFKKPDAEDAKKVQDVEARWARTRSRFVPQEQIPSGEETDRLHRWDYHHYREMFNDRQLLGLELSGRAIAAQSDERVRNALATNLSDLLRYQNMLCRYDTMALKSLDIFSVHGFPVGLIQCESNLLGIPNKGKASNVGSGGWSNIIDKFAKAKAYCDSPFEYRHNGRTKIKVPIPGEWIGDRQNGKGQTSERKVEILCADATTKKLKQGYLDAVLTDPPYFGNVQYAELMDFCYVWLRKLVADEDAAFKVNSTRNTSELTVNENMGRGLRHFAEGLSGVFREMARALKPGAPLAFTYHHNSLTAYYPVAMAILDAGLVCSASLPCPGEMRASIHISGTGSSIVDTIFVCRSTGSVPKRWIQDDAAGVAGLVREDVCKLKNGNVKPTIGDIRCITFGHLIRLCVWYLRKAWSAEDKVETKIRQISEWIGAFGGLEAVNRHLQGDLEKAPALQGASVREEATVYEVDDAQVSF